MFINTAFIFLLHHFHSKGFLARAVWKWEWFEIPQCDNNRASLLRAKGCVPFWLPLQRGLRIITLVTPFQVTIPSLIAQFCIRCEQLMLFFFSFFLFDCPVLTANTPQTLKPAIGCFFFLNSKFCGHTHSLPSHCLFSKKKKKEEELPHFTSCFYFSMFFFFTSVAIEINPGRKSTLCPSMQKREFVFLGKQIYSRKGGTLRLKESRGGQLYRKNLMFVLTHKSEKQIINPVTSAYSSGHKEKNIGSFYPEMLWYPRYSHWSETQNFGNGSSWPANIA